MSKERQIVHDRVGVMGAEVPVEESSFVDIPEEFVEDLKLIQKLAAELGDSRHEIGRLTQVMHHLVNVCNVADTNLTQAKQRIIEGMGLGEGNFAIDFERGQLGKISAVKKEVPRVV